MKNRSGEYVSNLSGEMSFRSFKPSSLPPEPPIEINGGLLKELIEANRKVAYLDGLASKRSDVKYRK